MCCGRRCLGTLEYFGAPVAAVVTGPRRLWWQCASCLACSTTGFPRRWLIHRHRQLAFGIHITSLQRNREGDVCIRKNLYAECRVVSAMFQEVVERMTKELTASAPSGMKIKVVAPPDNIILTVGAKRFAAWKCCPRRRSTSSKTATSSLDAERFRVRKCYFIKRFLCAAILLPSSKRQKVGWR